MRLFRMLAGLLLAAATAGHASAEVPRADVRAFMERSGIVAQLAEGAKQIREILPQQLEGESPSDLTKPFTDLVVDAWDDQKLIAALEVAYSEALTPDDLAAGLAFLDTSLGRRVVELEVKSGTVEAAKEVQAKEIELVATLESDPARWAAVRRIDEALRVTDISATVIMTLVRAGVLAAAGKADPDTIAQIDEIMEIQRPQLIELNRRSILAGFAYTYRALSLDGLAAYADVLESKASRTMNGIFFAVIDEYYQAVGEEIGEGMGALFRQKRS